MPTHQAFYKTCAACGVQYAERLDLYIEGGVLCQSCAYNENLLLTVILDSQRFRIRVGKNLYESCYVLTYGAHNVRNFCLITYNHRGHFYVGRVAAMDIQGNGAYVLPLQRRFESSKATVAEHRITWEQVLCLLNPLSA